MSWVVRFTMATSPGSATPEPGETSFIDNHSRALSMTVYPALPPVAPVVEQA